MKKRVYTLLLAVLFTSLLTGCTEEEIKEGLQEAAEYTDDVASIMAEDESALTVEDILAANTAEKIFADYKALNLKEHDFVQDRDTEDYFSEKINYRTGPDYFSLISNELVVTDDPQGTGYGCIIDAEAFKSVYESYMTIDWTDYSAGETTLNDDNTITVIGEYEDYIITYDPDTMFFLTKQIKNKDGSDWITVEYEYLDEDRDAEIMADVQIFIDEKSNGEWITLSAKSDADEQEISVPMGFSPIIYSYAEYVVDEDSDNDTEAEE